MVIDLKSVFEISGSCEKFSCELSPEELALPEDRELEKAVEIEGRVTNTAGIVEIEYVADFCLKYHCDRCLKEGKKKFSFSFRHTLTMELNDENDDGYIVVGNGMLDVTELSAEDIILEIPVLLLCKSGCKGLCQKCGADLNEGDCGCAVREIDPRLQKLKDLLN